MSKILQDKVAIVTGGSRGIGRAIVEKLAQSGASVAFTYHSSKEKAEILEKEMSNFNVKVKAYQSNAASFEEAEVLIKAVLADFGKIDILVNNAGITRDTLLLRMKEEQWQEVLQTNLSSMFNMVKQVLRPMLGQRHGSIINISSIVGMRGNAGQANYAASKAGIIGLSKSIAQELGSRNIRCNVVAPGYISTDMTNDMKAEAQAAFIKNIPLKRVGDPAEVADVVLFLASDMASYVSGQVLSVCGGLNC